MGDGLDYDQELSTTVSTTPSLAIPAGAVGVFCRVWGWLAAGVGDGKQRRAGRSQPAPRSAFRRPHPKLAQITDDVLYGDIWERPELSKRDRSLATVANSQSAMN